ncbi:MAG: FeoB-associated Cys-rich membrane protein [Clostridia bacterium]|nr:FeoB-associated Cys-rich membrane protein [Clostridia bacterium]
MAWLIENLATILISLALVAVVTAIVVDLIRKKREGKSSCGCGCSSCPSSSICHTKK